LKIIEHFIEQKKHDPYEQRIVKIMDFEMLKNKKIIPSIITISSCVNRERSDDFVYYSNTLFFVYYRNTNRLLGLKGPKNENTGSLKKDVSLPCREAKILY
jgi:hypothetical protein